MRQWSNATLRQKEGIGCLTHALFLETIQVQGVNTLCHAVLAQALGYQKSPNAPGAEPPTPRLVSKVKLFETLSTFQVI